MSISSSSYLANQVLLNLYGRFRTSPRIRWISSSYNIVSFLSEEVTVYHGKHRHYQQLQWFIHIVQS